MTIRSHHLPLLTVLLMTAALAVIVLRADAGQAAGSQRVNAVVKTTFYNSDGVTRMRGTVSGKPLGSGSVTGTASIPKFSSTLKLRGGSVRVTATLSGYDPVKGSWRYVSGTGRYRNISGGGTFRGRLVGERAELRFTGTARR